MDGRTFQRCILSATAFAMLVFAGCDSGGGITEPGTGNSARGALDLVLSTPNGDDGGLLFSVSGGVVDSVTAAGHALQTARVGGSVKVLAVGALSNGATVARIWVPDVSKVSEYAVAIQQVASRGSFTQRDPQPYRISVVRP